MIMRNRLGFSAVISCLTVVPGVARAQTLADPVTFSIKRTFSGTTIGVPQELGPLNSYSRRIVHLEVGRYDDVASESQGDGQLKHVIISVRKPAR